MAMGRPLVSTQMAEIIEDGVTGLIVPYKNSPEIARKVMALLSNGELARKLGAKAQEEIKKHDVHAYVKNLEKIYDDLALKSKGKK